MLISNREKGSGAQPLPKYELVLRSLRNIRAEPLNGEVCERAIFVHLSEDAIDFFAQCGGRQAGGFVERGSEVFREDRRAKFNDREARGDVSVHDGLGGHVADEVFATRGDGLSAFLIGLKRDDRDARRLCVNG